MANQSFMEMVNEYNELKQAIENARKQWEDNYKDALADDCSPFEAGCVADSDVGMYEMVERRDKLAADIVETGLFELRGTYPDDNVIWELSWLLRHIFVGRRTEWVPEDKKYNDMFDALVNLMMKVAYKKTNEEGID